MLARESRVAQNRHHHHIPKLCEQYACSETNQTLLQENLNEPFHNPQY